MTLQCSKLQVVSEDLWVQKVVVPTFAVESDDPGMKREIDEWVTFRNSLKPCEFRLGIELWCEAMQQKLSEKALLSMKQERDMYRQYIQAQNPTKRFMISRNMVRIY